MKDLQFDLNWDDGHVMPEVIYPDLAFMFKKIDDLTVRAVCLEAGSTLLDIGCGRASEILKLRMPGCQCLGLEPSSAMLGHAIANIRENGGGDGIGLLKSVAEALPFQDACVERIICKGAIDHFTNPELAVRELSRVLKEKGKAIIMVANYESLGFKAGRFYVRVLQKLGKKGLNDDFWKIPGDHNFKTDLKSIRKLIKPSFATERVSGISLLFGLPYWSSILSKLPERLSRILLILLDKAARPLPGLADAILIECRPIKVPRPASVFNHDL